MDSNFANKNKKHAEIDKEIVKMRKSLSTVGIDHQQCHKEQEFHTLFLGIDLSIKKDKKKTEAI